MENSSRSGRVGASNLDKARLRPMTKRSSRVIDLDRYVPAYLTWIANKLSRGASQYYLLEPIRRRHRDLALLGAARDSQVRLGAAGFADRRNGQGLGQSLLQEHAGQGAHHDEPRCRGRPLRIATLTAKGRALHDQILGVALERERALPWKRGSWAGLGGGRRLRNAPISPNRHKPPAYSSSPQPASRSPKSFGKV